jgi:SagB-type dehydrogenase family enzyme
MNGAAQYEYRQSKLIFMVVLLLTCFLLGGCNSVTPSSNKTSSQTQGAIFKLPEPRLRSTVSLEQTLLERRSIREYAPKPITLEEVSQLLWAAQGQTSDWGGRTAPGATYPLETYLVAGNVKGLGPGIYRYIPSGHELIKVKDGDVRDALVSAALGQSFVGDASICIVLSAVYERTTARYGDRGIRYVHMEAGHAAQNIYLEATALKLGTVTVGAFDDQSVKDTIDMANNETPLYIVPVGRLISTESQQ